MIPSVIVNNLEAQHILLSLLDPDEELYPELWTKNRADWTKADWELSLSSAPKPEGLLNHIIKKCVSLVESNETRERDKDRPFKDQTDTYRWMVDHFKGDKTYERKYYFKS